MANPEKEQKPTIEQESPKGSPKEGTRELAQTIAEQKAATALVKAESTNEEAEAKEEGRARDVRELMKQHEVFFVHAMQKDVQTPWSSGLHKGVDWSTQLKILLTLEPTLSTSTIKAGDTERNFWASMGVILNRGSVLGGGAGDIGSVGRGRQTRDIGSAFVSVAEARKSIGGIENAITKRGWDDYNELAVEHPKVAGFFVLVDEAGFPSKDKVRLPFEEIFQQLETLRMPIFAVTEGKIYRTSGFDKKDGRVIKEENPVTLEKISAQPFELPEEQKEKIKEQLLLDSPFICESPEALYIGMRAEGQGLYVELNTETILNRAQEHGEVEVIQTSSETDRTRYFVEDGALIKERTSKHQKERPYRGQIDSRTPHFLPFILEEGKTLEQKSVKSNEEYLAAMERALPLLREEGKPDKLNRFAFHLYGFAEQAEAFGDSDTAERARALATQVAPQDQYRVIVDRRLDTQGRFRITREELEGESKSHVV